MWAGLHEEADLGRVPAKRPILQVQHGDISVRVDGNRSEKNAGDTQGRNRVHESTKLKNQSIETIIYSTFELTEKVSSRAP